MRAVTWQGPNKVTVENVPDPTLLNQHDAIIKVRLTSICGSDLHLYDGFVPSMLPGDIIGHEFMGEVVAIGKSVRKLKIGDRVVVSSIIGCGKCWFCEQALWSLCDNSNPNNGLEAMYGYTTSGIFGYSHLFGGYAGSHAEYIRVPFADQVAFVVPENLSDEQTLFVSDAFPTGYQAALFCDIHPGDTVAVWGAGAVGLFAMRSAYMLGAEKVIAIDRFPERLEHARVNGHAVATLDYTETDVIDALKELTGGRGPDSCIDAVGMEAHAGGLPGMYDKVKQSMRVETDRPHVLRQAIQACRKGGTFSIIGVYAGLVDKLNMGAAFNKGLTFRMGQMHGPSLIPDLLGRVERGEIDPSFAITHRMSLEQASEGYETFKHKNEQCLRVVFQP
ncbi:MAG: glutathione-dependent formaldehyde dehydrogenase [Anaerolineae bacterium]|jgi:threonine dehydrogenase-like Zn-dependent dehydrogenase|nr:glutathione-dependent formaldehyde dehydrogenase [Anaerolineae bacterium]